MIKIFIVLLMFFLKGELFINLFLLSFMYLGILYSYESGVCFGMISDSLSILMMLLLLWIIWAMMMSGLIFFNKQNYLLIYFNAMFILLISLLASFGISSLLGFYIFFEMSIIPTFFFIMGWGYSMERFQAAMYMFIYTLTFSLPFLIWLFNFFYLSKSLNFFYFEFMYFLNLKFWIMVLIGVFLVKTPIYMLHLWLPKAHVEAPLIGSMVLAGVLLKMGGYGMIRGLQIWFKDSFGMMILMMIFFLFGSLYLSLVCMRQIDMKMLVAYSSVVHMSMVVVGMFVSSSVSVKASIMIMLSHGYCSSGMFYFLNTCYERYYTRSLMLLKGGVMMFPVMSFLWFSFCVFNMAAPPSLNFVSELTMILSILNLLVILGLIGMLFLFFSGVYSIYLYISFIHGNVDLMVKAKSGSVRDLHIMIFHLFPILALVMNLQLLN